MAALTDQLPLVLPFGEYQLSLIASQFPSLPALVPAHVRGLDVGQGSDGPLLDSDSGVLYVYRCSACGYAGEVRRSNDSHDGDVVPCSVCTDPTEIEWDGGVELVGQGSDGPLPSPGFKHCYQCDRLVSYLFEDGRCSQCTRLTPEEVVGVVSGSGGPCNTATLYHGWYKSPC